MISNISKSKIWIEGAKTYSLCPQLSIKLQINSLKIVTFWTRISLKRIILKGCNIFFWCNIFFLKLFFFWSNNFFYLKQFFWYFNLLQGANVWNATIVIYEIKFKQKNLSNFNNFDRRTFCNFLKELVKIIVYISI